MTGKFRRTRMFAWIFVLLMLMGAASAEAKLVPKVDNFILFVDQSGSMYMRHQECGEVVKMALAKQLLAGMNELIPELGYQGGLYMFAPFQPVLPPAVYQRARFAEGISKIPDNQGIYDRLTPMGYGLSDLGPVLAQLKGRTAVIMITDGCANYGTDPIEEARQLYSQYPDLCIHMISLADKRECKATLDRLDGLKECSILANGCALLKEGMPQFVRDVFYDEVPEAPAKEKMVLRGILFDFDKYNIKPEWEPVLDEAAQMLRQDPNVRVLVAGHTDAIGTEAYNQVLSERRAQAVMRYLAAKGIAADRMKAVGYGESRPVATNATAEGRQLNRRVELEVVR